MMRSSEPISRLELKDGRIRYRAVCDFGADPGTGKRKQVRRTFDTKSAARDWLAAARTGRRAGTLVTPMKETVDDALNSWMLGARHLKPSTRYGYEIALKPVRQHLGRVPVQALTRRHVDELIEEMLTTGGRDGTGRSPATIRQTLVVFEQAIDDAVRECRTTINPVRLVKKPRQRRTEMKTWTATQLSAFLTAANGDRYGALWRVAAFGLRRSEVVGLRWTDVNFEAGAINIVQTRVALGGSKVVVTGEPKTEQGRRTVPLDVTTVDALRRFRATQAAERLAAGAAYTDTDLVAVDEIGRPVRPEHFGDLFRKISLSADLPPIRLHDLRHTAASLMHESGTIPLRTLARMLGHADPAFTLRTYAHASDDAMSAASDTLARLIAGAGDAIR